MACCCEADFSRLGQVSLWNLLPPLARSFEIWDAASGVPLSGKALVKFHADEVQAGDSIQGSPEGREIEEGRGGSSEEGGREDDALWFDVGKG